MTRRLVNITLDNLDDLPRRCRKCVFWELDPVAGARAAETGDTELEKEAWVSAVLLEWGSCGKLIYVDGVPAGYVLFAPPAYIPRSVAFPTSPVSADAALLMTAEVLPDFGGGGLARMLVQGVAKDLTRRGIKAVEAFGGSGDEYARWTMLRKLAPAFRSMMVNTHDNPIMDIFRQYEQTPRSEPAKAEAVKATAAH